MVGIEELSQAVEDARDNARANRIESCVFLQGTVEEQIKKFTSKREVKTMILNPPRKGCSEKVLQAVSKIAPEKIIYVSCNPATLARDLTRLRKYQIDDLAVFDLFPQTQHVETAVLLHPTAP